ncbi:transposase [Streptomyces sp. NPDC051976]|uniref:transposase n=1 Tax=Streptomyces sp. NPDC051976 TaxID=3154947 RepID=UPI0034325DD6
MLLDLDGVSVIRVEQVENGTRRVQLATADASARACPACGVFASRVKGTATTRPRDLPYGEHGLEFLWHKRRWWCREASCPRKSFTEQIPQIPAGARLTERLRCAAAHRVRDAGSTVVQAARDLGLSWPVVMDAFRVAAVRVTEAELPGVEVLGIDETRCGRTWWEQDPDSGKWQLTRDRWHTGFVDALGSGGLLGQVEGRTVADVLAWLSTTELNWRKGIRYVAIDMSATCRAAVRTGLPHAIVVVGHCHVVQLANKMLSLVRRRTTAQVRGGADGSPIRSGRPGDACCATGKTSPMSSSNECGTPCSTRGVERR